MRAILCNDYNGNSYLAAKILAEILVAELLVAETADLSRFEFVVFVCQNAGDEELPPKLEDFFKELRVENKVCAICELGNYFGFEKDFFGCKKIVMTILQNLGWVVLDHISIDSFPQIDKKEVKEWGTCLLQKLTQ